MPTKKTYSIAEKGFLAAAFNKSGQTIERWIKLGDDRLTSERAKTALKRAKKIK